MPIEHDLYNIGTEEGQCPECGTDLDSVDPRQHAIMHYGEDPLPERASTRLARQRRAVLLGQDIPEF